MLPDVVDGSVAGDSADLLALSRTGSVAGILLDVVLDKRVGRPAVEGDKNGSGGGAGRASELDVPVSGVSNELGYSKTAAFLPVGTRPPSLADNEVACIGKVHGVAVAGRAVVDVAARLVVLVVVLSANKILGAKLEVRGISHGLGDWSSESASNGSEPERKSRKGNHVEVFVDVIEK